MHVVQEVTLNKEVNYFAQETNDFYGQPYAVFVFPSLQINGFIAGWKKSGQNPFPGIPRKHSGEQEYNKNTIT